MHLAGLKSSVNWSELTLAEDQSGRWQRDDFQQPSNSLRGRARFCSLLKGDHVEEEQPLPKGCLATRLTA